MPPDHPIADAIAPPHTALAQGAQGPGQDLPALAQLEQYWRGLRGTGGLPGRQEIETRAIDAALPHAFILDRVAPRVGRLRVGGAALNACLGMEVRGMPLTAFFAPACRDVVADLMQEAFDGPAIIGFSVQARLGLLRGTVTGRVILLPLAGPDGQINRALGAIVVPGAEHAGALRFDLPAPDRDGGGIRRERLGPTRPALRLLQGDGRARGPGTARPALRLVTPL